MICLIQFKKLIGKEGKAMSIMLLLAGGLGIVILAVIIAIVAAVSAAVATESNTEQE